MRRFLRKRRNLFLIFSGVIGVVLVWRGVWGIMDTYLFPGHPELSYGISIAVGLFILLFDDLELAELDYGHKDKRKKKAKIVST